MADETSPEIKQVYGALTRDGRAALRGVFALVTNLGYNGLLTADAIKSIFDFMPDPTDEDEDDGLLRQLIEQRRDEALRVTAETPPWIASKA